VAGEPLRALISLGTNTSRLLVVRDLPGGGVEQVEHAQIGTRLGEGLRERGPLAPAAVERNLAAVRTFAARAAEHGASLSAIATSALRRAEDADAFGARVAQITGVPLVVISGAVEAEASFRGATHGAPLGSARVAVLDIGGGSTECAVGAGGVLEAARSLELGSVRVSERHPDLMGGAPGPQAHAAAAVAREQIRATVAPLAAFGPLSQVRCVAGTPLTLAAVAARSHVDRVSGTTLSLATLDATLDALLDLTLEARRALPGMLPQRADVIVGGGLVLSEALRALGAEAGLLESNDLLLGYLLMRRPAVTE
jgi:exopolyphosphatase/guanosine-5'-triphosphate,3'-diphosphate pyrophosphatase